MYPYLVICILILNAIDLKSYLGEDTEPLAFVGSGSEKYENITNQIACVDVRVGRELDGTLTEMNRAAFASVTAIGLSAHYKTGSGVTKLYPNPECRNPIHRASNVTVNEVVANLFLDKELSTGDVICELTIDSSVKSIVTHSRVKRSSYFSKLALGANLPARERSASLFCTRQVIEQYNEGMIW